MATASSDITPTSSENTDSNNTTDQSPPVTSAIMFGSLTKEGGVYRTWKKRHFILEGTTLRYYKKEGDPAPKGTIDLTNGRGVRAKGETKNVEWPDAAKKSLSFAVAIEGRTYYFYGEDTTEVKNWKREISAIIDAHGKYTSDWEEDSEGQPEPAISKAIRGAAKLGTEIVKKFVKESGVVDEDTANIVEGVADGVKNQAEADHNTSITDRVKMAAGDTAGVVGDNVDNDAVGVVCDVVQEQAEADDDATLTQRVGMAAGTGLQGASEMVDNDIGAGVMNVTGGIIHDQAEADPDASIQERIAIGVGSTAAGVGDAIGDDTGEKVCKGIEKGAEKVTEVFEEKRSEKEEKEKDDEEEEED